MPVPTRRLFQMRSVLLSLVILSLFSSCATAVQKSKPRLTSKNTKLSKTSKKALFSKKYVKVLSFVSSNQRKIISEIVDGRGKSLRGYANILGIKNDQYSTFKKILKQNLPKLIQYNEPDAFQARVQDLLINKRVILSAIRPQIQ